MREPEGTREQFEILQSKYGTALMVPIKKIAEELKTKPEYLIADKNFPVKKIGGRYYVNIYSFAKYLVS